MNKVPNPAHCLWESWVRMRLNKFSKEPALAVIAIIIIVALMGGGRIAFYLKSPDVLLLHDRAGAQWIKYDSDFQLEARAASRTESTFKYTFNTNESIDGAEISIQALKQFCIIFDGAEIFSSPDDFSQWKKVHLVKIPFPVASGPHEIVIRVVSESSHPAVIAYSDTLPVSTGTGWFASHDGNHWRTAVPASLGQQSSVSKSFPSSINALVSILPYLTIVFMITLLVSLFFTGSGNTLRRASNWKIEPGHIRWAMLFLWTVLSINNIFRLNFQVGADGWGHIDYINYIAIKGSLPLAPEGWHMFQAPLSYIISAPLYALLMNSFDLPSLVKIMTVIPVMCGVLQIEIVYRVARLVFAGRKDLQVITIVTGAILPVHTYTCQYVGNEPLTALLISLLMLLCFHLIIPDNKERTPCFFVVMGLVWGLGLLSKMTALLLAPVILFVIIFHMKLLKKPLSLSIRPLLIIFGVSLLTSGWYYFRNYIKLGNPFAGVFEHIQMLQWWQDPSYRMFSHFFSFGQSLFHPVYAGVTSFWDMFYATLWLDGINSGLIDFIPWNENFMIAGALLALLPSLFILASVVLFLANKDIAYKNAILFSIIAITVFVVAMLDMYMICPLYSRTKASYTLGLLPCYAVLIAAGAEPFLRNRFVRSIVLALFACWAFAAYAAYFVVKYQ
jgi:hypothetical protein